METEVVKHSFDANLTRSTAYECKKDVNYSFSNLRTW